MPDDAGGHPDKGASMVSGVSVRARTARRFNPKASGLRLYSLRNNRGCSDLAHEWVGILNDAAAAAGMAEIKANLPETWFAWSGPTTQGSAAYFRIQGPTLLN